MTTYKFTVIEGTQVFNGEIKAGSIEEAKQEVIDIYTYELGTDEESLEITIESSEVNKMSTIQLQSIGHVPAIQASEVREGDVRMFNFGSTSLVIKVIEKTAKTLSLITFSDGKYYVTDIRKTSLVAIVDHNQGVSEHRPTQAWYKRDGMIDVSEYFPTIEQVEEQQLEKYHLELQEKGMELSATKPEINMESSYKVVVSVDRDTDQVGEFEKVLTGKELDFQLSMNEVLEIIEEIKPETFNQSNVITTSSPVETTPAIEETTIQSEITYQTGTGSKGNGIEITFTSKPSEELRNALKANGYRWGGKQRSNIWWAILNDQTLSLAESIAGEGESITEPVEYPYVNIDDNESYTISQRIQDAEHESGWIFRSEKRDHNKILLDMFTDYTNKVKSIIANTENEFYIYKLTSGLQRFKKKYHDLYTRYLSHKGINPSWAVTGRGNLNVSRYNKARDREHNIINELATLPKEFESYMNKYRNKIKKEQKAS